MADWYYERGGAQYGPVDEDELRQLYSARAIDNSTLVWTSALQDNWVRLDASGLTFMNTPRSGPPPLPPAARPEQDSAPKGASQATATPVSEEGFLASDLTKALVGPRSGSYLVKWTRMVEKSGGDLDKASKARSWNWPAFLFPFAWPFYRKLWKFGALVLLATLVIVLIPEDYERVARAAGIGLGCACGVLANGLYLHEVRQKWTTLARMPDRKLALAIASQQGGTSIVGCICGVTALFVLAVIGVGGSEFREIFASNVDCSSASAKETVYRIAREHMGKSGLAFAGVDIPGTRIELEAIRTRDSNNRRSECAASLKYVVKLKQQATPKENADAATTSINNILSTDITYTVENTDDGQNIYVTVYGLKQ